MSEGWGQDFDEDGNVIGDVPEKDPSFFDEHKYKIAAVSALWFLLGIPRIDIGNVGALFGAAIASVFVGALLVYVGVGIQKRI